MSSASTWTDLGDNAFGADGCARAAGDLDGDSCVGGGDLGVIFTNWGRCF